MPARGGWRLQAKGAFVLLTWVGLYALSLSLDSIPGLCIAALAGLWAYTLGTTILHECSHKTFAVSRSVNAILFFVSSVPMGMSPTSWYQEHIIRHHPHTNVHEADMDIDQNRVLRFTPHHIWRPIYAWQHIYMWPLYGMVMMSRTWIREIRRLVNNEYELQGRAYTLFAADIVMLRLCHVGMLVAAPAYAFGSLGLGLLYYFVHMYALGVVFSFGFQMTHINQRCSYPAGRESQTRDWVIRQLETTVNWGVDRPLVTWLSGGLNMQVVHHVFQNINHLHHPQIREIIRDYCEEQGLPYHEHGDVYSSLREHVLTIRALGLRPQGEGVDVRQPARA